MQTKQIRAYSFPVAAMLLGMVVGTFCFIQQPANDRGSLQRLLKPAGYGLTTTYVALTLGINLRLARERQLRSEKRAAERVQREKVGSGRVALKAQKKVGCHSLIFGCLPKLPGDPTLKSNNTIPATLDLTQSLESFEREIAPEMSLSGVSQWDGRNISERERKIRQAALILAGQCIALLLHKLSESKEAHITAVRQTKGWRHPKSKGNGRVERQVLCLGNVVVCLRLPYVVERLKQPHSKRRTPRGQGCAPIFKMVVHGRRNHATGFVYCGRGGDSKWIICHCSILAQSLGHYH